MDAAKETDAELARACRKGSAAAWRRLVRRFTPQVYRLALRMLRLQAEAEEASQEVFARVHRSLDTYDGIRPLAPWINRITYNVCLRRLQRAAKRAETGERPVDGLRSSDPGPEQRAAQSEVEQLMGACLDQLSAQDRALIVMRYRDGFTDVEVAEATGMPVNTVKTRLFRARAQLRKRLGPLVRKEEL